MTLNDDDLLKVSGGEGNSLADMYVEIAAWLQQEGLLNGSATNEQIDSIGKKMNLNQVATLRTLLCNKGYSIDSMPDWLRVCLTNLYETKILIDTLTKGEKYVEP